MTRFRLILALIILSAVAAGCGHGWKSDKPPLHPNPNMDDQEKFKAQAENTFFTDGAAMRQPVPGTIAMGSLRADSVYFAGKDSRGNFVTTSPVPLTMELLERGRERFNIYCSPCHGETGYGQGIVVKRGLMAPTSFHDERLVNETDGYIYDVITNGIRNMPPYKYQIPVADRWAIVAYVRALQRSQLGTIEDIPPGVDMTE